MTFWLQVSEYKMLVADLDMSIGNKDIMHLILDISPVLQNLMVCNLLKDLFLICNNKNRSKPNLLTSWYSFVFYCIVHSVLCQWQCLWLIFSYCSSAQVFHSLSTAETVKYDFRTWQIICLVLWLQILCHIVFFYTGFPLLYNCKVHTCELDMLGLEQAYVTSESGYIRESKSMVPVYCPSLSCKSRNWVEFCRI